MDEISCPYESFELSCLNEEYYEEIQNENENNNSNDSSRLLPDNDIEVEYGTGDIKTL